MKYSVCASALYSKLLLPEAVERIAALGYSAFEFWGWWDHDIDATAKAQKKSGITAAGMCTRMVPLNDPTRRAEYIEGLKESIEMAKKLDCKMLISQVGQAIPGVSRAEQHQSIVEGLRACAPILEEAGIVLAVEPLNILVNHKGYYLDRSDEGFAIIREVGSPYVKLLFDVYHQQITEGNLIQNITQNIDAIAHIHIAGNPGRHEPQVNSEVHYPTILKALKDAGYQGYVGLEYSPLMDPDQSLKDVLEKMPI